MLSIVIPVHDAAKTLDVCLESVVAALPPNSEIVVINDGSRDASAEIISRWAHALPEVIRVIEQPNRGRGATRNIGINESCGTYIGFVDADDTVDPSMYTKLLERALSTNADVVVCDYAATDAEMNNQLFIYDSGCCADFGGCWETKPNLIKKFGASSCNKIMRKDLIDDARARDPKPIRYPEHLEIEDVATLLPLAFRAKHVEKIDEVLYLYRHHTKGSISRRYDEHYFEVIEAIKIMNARIDAMKLGSGVSTYQLWLSLEHIFRGRFSDLFPNASLRVSSRYAAFAFHYLDGAFPKWEESTELFDVIQSDFKRRLMQTRALFIVALFASKAKQYARQTRAGMR